MGINYHRSSDNILNSKYKRFYRKFNSTLKLLQPYVNNLILDELNINIFSFKIYSKKDKNPNNKLYDYFNKYLTDSYLFLPIENPTGAAFCYNNDTNVSRDMILECFGICLDSYLNEEQIIFGEFNNLKIDTKENPPNITLIGFIHKSIYDYDLEYPYFEIYNISKGCVNDLYNFNISGEIDGIKFILI